MITTESRRPLIADVKRHCLADGPGIRSVVFFKGCPLRCRFCHNPETQSPGVEIAFYPQKCLRCGACVEACEQDAIDLHNDSRVRRDRCGRCGHCAAVCPAGGLMRIGRWYPVEELAEVLVRDLPFYVHSGGGVTLSGGEATLYPDYVAALCDRLKDNSIHIALETCGEFAYHSFREKILPYIDLVYYDIKLADPERHREFTGRTNERIMANLRRLLAEPKVEVHPRVPLIPGVTDTRENLAAIVDFLLEAGADDVTLLPYNPLGQEMAVALGRPQPPRPERFMDPDEEIRLRRWFAELVTRKHQCLVS